jgi:hypothetical protein
MPGPVIFSSGPACQCMGLGHCEKSHVGKESVRPCATFDAVFFKRRQHALIPHRDFHSRPSLALGSCALFSPCGHYRRLALALSLCGTHASTVRPPVPRCGFALCASRGSSPPNRVRYPTDQPFASGCSPPRLAATQLPSATELWHTPTRTFTVLMRRPHGRTMRPGTRRMYLTINKLDQIVKCTQAHESFVRQRRATEHSRYYR